MDSGATKDDLVGGAGVQGPWLLAQNFCVPVANRNCIVGIVVTGPDVHTGRARFWLAAVSIRARTICLCTWSLMAGVPIVSVAMKGVPNCGERSLLLPLISDLVASVALRTLQVSVGSRGSEDTQGRTNIWVLVGLVVHLLTQLQ